MSTLKWGFWINTESETPRARIYKNHGYPRAEFVAQNHYLLDGEIHKSDWKDL